MAKKRCTTKLAATIIVIIILFYSITITPYRGMPSQKIRKKTRSPITSENTLTKTNEKFQTFESWEKTIETIHFSVHYNETGSNAVTEEYAINVSDSLEHAWTKIVIDFGFAAPPDSHMNVYIQDIDAYGITYYYGPPYHVQNITIDTQLSINLIRVTCAHEFFHTIQLSYDITEEDWIIEGTATWIESKIYPYFTETGSYIDYVNQFMSNPDRTITNLSYEAVLFWIFIDEHYGGINIVKNILQQTITNNGIYAVNTTLISQGTTFAKTFRDFTIANILKDTYYSKGYLFNSVAKTTFTYNGTRVQFSADVADWGAKYYETSSTSIYMETQFLGTENHNVTKILIDDPKAIISDIPLNNYYNGSFRLMPANLLDKIIIVVKSIANETASSRRNYTIIWLGEIVTSTGPYEQTSSSVKFNIPSLGAQASTEITIESFNISSAQYTTIIYSNIINDKVSQNSNPQTTNLIAKSITQTSTTTTLDCLKESVSQTSQQTKLATIDNTSSQVSSQTTIQVGISPPIASFTYFPSLPSKNETITFDASSSYDPDGYIVEYTWDFGDGNKTSTPNSTISHIYANANTYTVTLNVTDDQGLWSTLSKTVTVYETAGISVNITHLSITDQNGNPKSNFQKGEIAQFNFTIQNTGSLDLNRGLVSLIIIDPADTPIFLSYTFEDLKIGTYKEFIIGCSIPLNGVNGTYTVQVMVFTNWPSQGGAGLAKKTSIFNVGQ